MGTKNKFVILGSAHDIKEIIIKINKNTDIIFLSPLFEKNNNKKLGIIKFNLIRKILIKIYVIFRNINQKIKKC